jgi:hypothetical protein
MNELISKTCTFIILKILDKRHNFKSKQTFGKKEIEA